MFDQEPLLPLDDRARWEGLTVQEQIAEDTCKKHGVFICPLCYNMTPIKESE